MRPENEQLGMVQALVEGLNLTEPEIFGYLPVFGPSTEHYPHIAPSLGTSWQEFELLFGRAGRPDSKHMLVAPDLTLNPVSKIGIASESFHLDEGFSVCWVDKLPVRFELGWLFARTSKGYPGLVSRMEFFALNEVYGERVEHKHPWPFLAFVPHKCFHSYEMMVIYAVQMNGLQQRMCSAIEGSKIREGGGF